uniref:Ferredoxin--nitrite reductase, chloroplastic n=1 Tax=Oryza barthii TaxID=65489 RepID=A0A0D3FAW4_9ORYZ
MTLLSTRAPIPYQHNQTDTSALLNSPRASNSALAPPPSSAINNHTRRTHGHPHRNSAPPPPPSPAMASSASLQRFLPLSPHVAASRRRPPAVRTRPMQSSTVSAPSSSTPAADDAVSAERLEPWVEQREGRYWVLKEKYRAGLNPQEKVKLGKEPISLFMEGGIRSSPRCPWRRSRPTSSPRRTSTCVSSGSASSTATSISKSKRSTILATPMKWNILTLTAKILFRHLAQLEPWARGPLIRLFAKHILVFWGPRVNLAQNANGRSTALRCADGRFMMRLKLPNGVTTSEQTRYLASVIEAYGKDGCADVTTRQNWQIRGVTLPDVPAILDGLKAVGLTNLQSGMNNVRNPVGNPLAGIDPDEIVDTRSYTNLLSSYITSNFQGNPTITNLPRKWNVCVVGSHDLYEHPHINDLAYMPAVKDGKFGFNLLVGGFISPKRWEEALPLDAWVPGDDIIPVCKAVLEAYRDLGTRGNRQKTRMMWLIDELLSHFFHAIGMEVFWSEVEKRMPNGVLERAAPDDLIDKKWQRRDYLGVHPQKQEGLSYVGLHVPVGRVQAADMFELARLADEYGSGELRLTVEQNIVIPNVKDEKVEALLAEPLLQKFSPQPSLLLKGLVACTGNQFCGQAIIETKQRALLVTSQVEKLVSVPRAVRMHWTGCPNSCGQVQVADIGFMGCLTKDSAGKIVEAADIFVGGRVGSDSHLAGVYKKSVPCDELAPIVADILVERFGAVRREREENEE